MAQKKTDKVVVPKKYNSLEALEAEFDIPDVEPYSPVIAKDGDGKDVRITFRSPKDYSFEEMLEANEAEVRGDALTYFKLSLSASDIRKVQYYNLRAYQMGLLMAASQRYYDDAYGVHGSLGNSSGSDD